jgi:succinate-semialdehyde dehydrogenase/glutarate-semialdehyde dehydrogenase/succinyl-CoA reductase
MQCGIAIANMFQKAGFQDGIFQTLVGDSSVVEHLIDSDISAVTFTGSTSVGIKVGQMSASNLKKCVLELGGSDPFIVCSDADMAQ